MLLRECGIDFSRVSECCAAAMSYTANITLVYLILFRSSTPLRVYGRVLLANCAVDLAFTTASLVIESHYFVRRGILVMVHNGFIRTATANDTILVDMFYIWPLYTAILSITTPFLYRYFLICRNHKLRGPAVCALALVNAVIASVCPLTFRVYLYPDSQRMQELDRNVTDLLACTRAAEMPLQKIEFSLTTLVPITVVSMVVTYTYTIVLLCSWRIWQRLKTQTRLMSKRTALLQGQLNRMLFVQALSPFLVVVAPLTFGCSMIYFGTQEAESLVYVTTALSWMPVISAISTMYFVKEYRRTILSAMRIRTESTTAWTDESQTGCVDTNVHNLPKAASDNLV